MNRARRSSRDGFSLVELLVIIVVIAILVSLLLPALSGAKRAADLRARGQLARHLSMALAMYQSDHQEMFPFFGTPGDPLAYPVIDGVELAGGIAEAPVRFFSYHRWYWASAILPDYLDAPREEVEAEGVAEFLAFLGWPEGVIGATFQMVSVAFARPDFWSEKDALGQDAFSLTHLIQPTFLTDVRYPSQKGVLGEGLASPHHARKATPEMTVALGDSSVRVVPDIDAFLARPGESVKRPWGATGYSIDSTIDGLGGIDF